MWVLVVVALNTHVAFSVPNFSTEQTCSAEGKRLIAILSREKVGTRFVYHCINPR